jgi:hypothetical protein
MFTALDRALDIADSLKRVGLAHVPLEKRDLQPFATQTVQKIRNAVQHHDWIQATEPGDPLLVIPFAEGVTLEDEDARTRVSRCGSVTCRGWLGDRRFRSAR